MRSFEVEIMLEADVEYNVSKGRPEHFADGQVYPADPTDLEIKAVSIGVTKRDIMEAYKRAVELTDDKSLVQLNIWSALPAKERESIESLCNEDSAQEHF